MKHSELVDLIKSTQTEQWKDTINAIRDIQEQIKTLATTRTSPMTNILNQDAPSHASTVKVDGALMTARLIRALAAGKGDVDKAAAWNNKHWQDETVSKALAAGEATSGGFLVPPEFSQQVIELLRPMTVVRRMGPMVLPMTSGSMRIPKITAGSAASYVGENTNLPKTQPTFGQINLVFKKLAALVPVSNDLMRYSSPGADAIVRSDLVRAMAQREDQAFLRDDGTNSTPKGLRFWAPAGNLLLMTGTDVLADITTDLGKIIQKLRDANVPMTRPGWLMAPRTERRLMTIQNTSGFFVFRPEMLDGRLWTFPYAVTTQIPTNLGAGTESELYLVDFDDAVIGESQNLILDVSTEAAYHDGANVVAAFSLDQTVIRAISEHDFALRRDVACAIITNITWGA